MPDFPAIPDFCSMPSEAATRALRVHFMTMAMRMHEIGFLGPLEMERVTSMVHFVMTGQSTMPVAP